VAYSTGAVAAAIARPGTRAEQSSSECRAKTGLKSSPRECKYKNGTSGACRFRNVSLERDHCTPWTSSDISELSPGFFCASRARFLSAPLHVLRNQMETAGPAIRKRRLPADFGEVRCLYSFKGWSHSFHTPLVSRDGFT
jgi:hypothetical protein